MTTTKTIKIFKREALLIRRTHLPRDLRDKLVDEYTFRFYNEKGCQSCEFLVDRHSDICNQCAGYLGGAQLAKDIKVGEKKYFSLPIGDKDGVEKVLNKNGIRKYEFVDKHPKNKMKSKIKFTGKLRDYQPDAVKGILEKKKGVLVAPPRSGKCVVGNSVIYTNGGIHSIKQLFKNHKLYSTRATEIVAPRGLRIQTEHGLQEVSHLYTKIVDETVKVETVRGKIIHGTPQHPVRVVRNGIFLWVPLSQLEENDVLVANHSNRWTWKKTRLLKSHDEILIAKSSSNIHIGRLPSRLTPELAAVMGYLTADGRLGAHPALSFCNGSEEKLREFQSAWDVCFPDNPLKRSMDESRTPQLGVSAAYVRAFLEQCCGFSLVNAGLKRFPKILKTAPREIVMHFLAAYMSCDGEFKSTWVGFSSASFQFARDMVQVLTAMGYSVKSRTSPKDVQLDHKTLGKRIGKYGGLSMKRREFDRLREDLPFLHRELPPADSRELDQLDIIPGLRNVLNGLQNDRRVRIKKAHFWRTDSGNLLPIASYGRIIHDKRGPGRSPDMNRATAEGCVNFELIRLISKSHYESVRNLMDLRFSYEKIQKIRIINKPVRVYDVSVPKTRSFFANGILVHNTVMATAAICKIRRKTLILASQRDWLMGFYETFCGSKTQKALTDAKGSGSSDLETRDYLKKHKRAGVGFCRTYDQFMRHDVCLATVQTFYSESGIKLLRKLRDEFSVVFVDEIHTGAAPKYASILSKLNSEFSIGLSGTPDRKDGRWILMEKLMGKPVYEVKIKRLKPTVKLVRTAYKEAGKGQTMWTTMVSRLETNPARLKLIAEHAVKDVKDGHMVLIPLARVKAIKALTMAINKIAGKDIAYGFHGGVKKGDRDSVIQKARKYKVKVLVGQAKLISTGINIPRASAIYECSPSSNIPNCTQRVSRILTPYDDKPPPLLRLFLDDMNVRRACLRTEWWQCMKPVFKAIISEKDRIILQDYLSNKEREEKIEW